MIRVITREGFIFSFPDAKKTNYDTKTGILYANHVDEPTFATSLVVHRDGTCLISGEIGRVIVRTPEDELRVYREDKRITSRFEDITKGLAKL